MQAVPVDRCGDRQMIGALDPQLLAELGADQRTRELAVVAPDLPVATVRAGFAGGDVEFVFGDRRAGRGVALGRGREERDTWVERCAGERAASQKFAARQACLWLGCQFVTKHHRALPSLGAIHEEASVKTGSETSAGFP